MKQYIVFMLMVCAGATSMAMSVSVELLKNNTKRSISDFVPVLAGKTRPQIIIWFSGEDGLTERCLNFYKRRLFGQLNAQVERTKKKTPWSYDLYLYDLRCWKALKDKALSVTDISRSRFNCNKWTLLYAAGFFEWIKENKTGLSTILRRDNIWQESKRLIEKKKIPLNNLCVRDSSLAGMSLISSQYGSKDTAYIYSALQYLEGLYLVTEVVKRTIQRQLEQTNIPIIFLLPKGEAAYYIFNDNGNAFRHDVIELLESNKNVKVEVTFAEFDYTAPKTSRPYITTDKDVIASESLIKEVLGVW